MDAMPSTPRPHLRPARLAGLFILAAWVSATTAQTAADVQRLDTLPAGFGPCALEQGDDTVCAGSGEGRIAFGRPGAWRVATVRLPFDCARGNAVFGDPAPGVAKQCQLLGAKPADTGLTKSRWVHGEPGPRTSSLQVRGPIVAKAGQVIERVRISNPQGVCITIPPKAEGVTIRDSEIGPCGNGANVLVQAGGATIEHNRIFKGLRGVLAMNTRDTVVRANLLDTFGGPVRNDPCCVGQGAEGIGSAIEYDDMRGGTIEGNLVTGQRYVSDAVSVFQSSGVRLVDNVIDIDIAYRNAAAFTIGDSKEKKPGRDNYVAGNVVRQRGGVAAGVFGSQGNTVIERNCLTAGLQAYKYADNPFEGVVVRKNVIGPGTHVPDKRAIEGWDSNVQSTDCARMPQ